jgi:intracellular sulfur oxidation DsrE/DsrF family protein
MPCFWGDCRALRGGRRKGGGKMIFHFLSALIMKGVPIMVDEPTFANTVILLARPGMGCAEESLQHDLLDTYLNTLLQNNNLPAAICFYGEGVKLVMEDSPHYSLLSRLEGKGVHLIVCSTSLKFYKLDEKIRVGFSASMADILEAQLKAAKVISL